MRVGNAPVSWGVYESTGNNPPYGAVLDAIAAAGYAGTELGPYGYLPTSPRALHAELLSRGLALGSSFVPLPLEDPARREDSVVQARRVAQLLATQGVRELIVADDEDPRRTAIAGRVPGDGSAGFDEAQWAEATTTLQAVARMLRDELGMSVVVHHHAGTYVETPEEIDRLLAGTDPTLVNLLLDTGHAVYGGADPLDILARHGERVRYVHLKDVKGDELAHVRGSDVPMQEAWKRGVFCPLGRGVVDFPRVVERLRGIRYGGWVIVEQDVVPDEHGRLSPEPAESARQSRAYLREQVGL